MKIFAAAIQGSLGTMMLASATAKKCSLVSKHKLQTSIESSFIVGERQSRNCRRSCKSHQRKLVRENIILSLDVSFSYVDVAALKISV